MYAHSFFFLMNDKNNFPKIFDETHFHIYIHTHVQFEGNMAICHEMGDKTIKS